MSDVIYRGLKLSSNKCRYFQVKEGQISSIVEDTSRSTLTLTYSPGSTSGSLSDLLGIPCTEKELTCSLQDFLNYLKILMLH